MTCSDQHGRLHPLSKTRCLLTETTLVTPFINQRQANPLTREHQCGHLHLFVEDSMSIDQEYFSLFFLSSRDKRVQWHTRDYFSLSFHQVEASEPVDTQRPTWSSAPYVEDSMSINWVYFSLYFCYPAIIKSDSTQRDFMVIHTLAIQRQSSSIARGDNSWLFAPLSSRDSKSDDTQRQIWPFAPFVGDLMSIDRDYFSLPFINQRQASPLTRGNKYGHLHPLSKIQCLSTRTTLAPPLLPSRDNRVR